MNIQLLLAFDGAATNTPLWAYEEGTIDFVFEQRRAERCTTAFAAVELRHYLQRTLIETAITFSSQRSGDGFYISLQVNETTPALDGFRLMPEAGGLAIIGYSRAGLLYGVYELLRMQGWRWYAPGKNGEVSPQPSMALVVPEQVVERVPAFPIGRGFDFEYPSMESAELLLWMSRNRLNVCGLRPATIALSHKLGMIPKAGGHIFEAILDPDRPMSSGKTLWEEHPEWYGLPTSGSRNRQTAVATQFCVSQPDLIEYLAEHLLQRLQGPWHDAQRLDLWGFDTWGSGCSCVECRALGSSSDQILFFLGRMRDFLNEARRTGRLDHDVSLSTCAYEGTATLMGPHKPIPPSLLAAGDRITFYPINRCYTHNLADSDCTTNIAYQAALSSWLCLENCLPVIAAEYFNVSKYEDLPLLFTERIRNDLPGYHAQGVRGLTYMHLPMVNWAMRTLTQALYAQVAWDEATNVEAFISEYFRTWYGDHASKMRRVYELVEEAWRYIADWRAWASTSILSQLLAWDGARAVQPLKPTGHFDAPATAIASGQHSLELMQQAMRLINECIPEWQDRAARLHQETVFQAMALNPIQARDMEQSDRLEFRLGEDRRLLRYGMDVMRLMTEVVAYHEALRTDNRATAESLWCGIEQVADSLDSYYVPIGYEWPGPGLESKDGLTRSQLRAVLHRCRSRRSNSLLP